jgi:hypothetical protein|nr:MAG TPA: hypothetical protein [Bacteriophage sp.]DAL84139.1 MAG TPA: hypothetical protein [Caudoviricetes sp.]
MKVNFNKPLKTFRGEDMKDEFGKVQVIKDIVCARLYSSGDEMNEDEKYESYKLMTRINAADGDMDISDKESLLIKKCCNKTLTAGAFGQIFELLNV